MCLMRTEIQSTPSTENECIFQLLFWLLNFTWSYISTCIPKPFPYMLIFLPFLLYPQTKNPCCGSIEVFGHCILAYLFVTRHFKKFSLFTQCDSSNSQNMQYGNNIQSRLSVLSRQPQSKVSHSSWMFTDDFKNYCTCWVTLISLCNGIAETLILVIIIAIYL